jgi:[acyl-carrier-protein] S-malonyltransferase|tara:strand:- start:1667 stop:2596 length:930 start_codon:yes stop_codon:yes gene_type:complete
MTALIFPGQGSQFVGMAKDFYDEFLIARKTFELIENSTKINLRDIIFYNKSELLNITKYTQLAIFCSSMSIFNVLKNEIDIDKLSINYFLGHSLGEYTALTASNVISIEDCSMLLKIRGELMQDAYKENMSGMVAIIGLDCTKIEKIITDNNLKIEVANDNSPMQVVISGTKEDLLKSKNFIMKNGAKKFIFLNVSSAFHSRLMKNAENKMILSLNKVTFQNPSYYIISNFSAKDTRDSKIIFYNLTKQMSNKVRWVESIECLDNLNENKIIEIGPGNVLSGLIKRISKNFTIFNINSIDDLYNFANEL